MAAVDDEEIDSLSLPTGATNSRNDISDVGLYILANKNRIREDIQPLSASETLSAEAQQHRPSHNGDDFLVDPFAVPHDSGNRPETVYYHEEDRQKREQQQQTTVQENSLFATVSDDGNGVVGNIFDQEDRVGRADPSQRLCAHTVGVPDPIEDLFGGGGGAMDASGINLDEDDQLMVPTEGLFGDQCAPPPINVLDVASNANDNIIDVPSVDQLAGASRVDASLGPAAVPIDYSQTRQAMQSAATLGSFGELNRSNLRRAADSPVMAQRTPSISRSLSRSENRRHDHNHRNSRRRAESELSRSRDTAASRDGASESRRSRRRQQRGGRRREQTYIEFQEAIRSKVKQQEDMEKREMLLLFYQKQRFERAEVPKKFFQQGLSSDLYEMRWWYYKLIRETRINDEVASMKQKIVQGSRFALFINNTIGNPLNLRLDQNFPKELANTLNSSTDRHLREHIKSKCGVSGPKPRPWSHIIRDIWECGWNYHQNKLSMEEAEKRRSKKEEEQQAKQAQAQRRQPPPSSATSSASFDAYSAMRAMNAGGSQTHGQFVSSQPTQRVNGGGSGSGGGNGSSWQENYQRLVQHQALQRQMLEQQRPHAPPPSFQPDRTSLRNVFRHMSTEMRRQPIPAHLRPPSAPQRASLNTATVHPSMSLAQAARSLQQQIRRDQTVPPPPPPPQQQQRAVPTQPSPPPKPKRTVAQTPLQALPRHTQKKSLSSQVAPHRSGPPTASPRSLWLGSKPPPPSVRVAPLETRPRPPQRPRLLPPSSSNAAIVSKSTVLRDRLPRPPNPVATTGARTVAPTVETKTEPAPPPLRFVLGAPLRHRPPQPMKQSSHVQPFELLNNVTVIPVESIAMEYARPTAPVSVQMQTFVPPTLQRERSLKIREDAFSGHERSLQPLQQQLQHQDWLEERSSNKRSLKELMSELQSAHDDDEGDECDDNGVAEVDTAAPEMPAMDTTDRLTNALVMLEEFNESDQQNSEAKERASLYDIEDVMNLQFENISLSDVSKKTVGEGSKRVRRRHRRRGTPESEQAQSDNERATTPPPQAAPLRAATGAGRASLGRSGRKKVMY